MRVVKHLGTKMSYEMSALIEKSFQKSTHAYSPTSAVAFLSNMLAFKPKARFRGTTTCNASTWSKNL